MDDLWTAFERTVAAYRDRAALVSAASSTSFGEWFDLAAGFRRRYRSLHMTKGDRLLICAPNEASTAAAIAAAWGEGLIAVLADESVTGSQLDHMITVCDARAIVAGDFELPDGLAGSIATIRARDVGPAAMPVDRCPLKSTDYASIIFTSGSTGKPKGVLQSHGNLLRGCAAVAAYSGITYEDRILCAVPWSFDYGYGQLLASALQGTALGLVQPVNPSNICAAIDALEPTVLAGIASTYAYLVGGMSPIEDSDLSGVRLVMNTGGRMPGQVLERLRKLFGKADILLNYGLTESYRSCYLPPSLVAERPDSIGLPIPGVDIAIVDESGKPVAPGIEGEIVHRGDYIFHGYWNDPEATSRVLRPDPLSSPDAEGLALFTGDYGYRDAQGFLYFVGRRDHLIKSMGVRVSTAEAEDLLLASGIVSAVAVFGVPHDLMGHEIWAAVVPKDHEASPLQALRRYARSQMSRYMQPRRYLVLDRLPHTSTGKTNYAALREAADAEPSPQIL